MAQVAADPAEPRLPKDRATAAKIQQSTQSTTWEYGVVWKCGTPIPNMPQDYHRSCPMFNGYLVAILQFQAHPCASGGCWWMLDKRSKLTKTRCGKSAKPTAPLAGVGQHVECPMPETFSTLCMQYRIQKECNAFQLNLAEEWVTVC